MSEKDYLTIKEFCAEVGIGYGAYRAMRERGKAPAEMRLSRRTVRISRQAIKDWRLQNEETASQLPISCGAST